MRIYADTSVFGGMFDEEFVNSSEIFFERLNSGYFTLVTSTIVENEIFKAPLKVQDFFSETTIDVEFLDLNPNVLDLVQAYLDANILTPKFIDDARHVALVTVSCCDIIVSWNFKHIVNFNKIPKYNTININNGYSYLSIVSPEEVIKYGQ